MFDTPQPVKLAPQVFKSRNSVQTDHPPVVPGLLCSRARETLPLKTRSIITIATLAALKAPNELKGHVRGAIRNGCTPEEIREVLLHTAPYIGAPALQEAFRAAKEVLDEE